MADTDPSTTEVVCLDKLTTYNFDMAVEHYGAWFWAPRLIADSDDLADNDQFRVGYVCTTGDKPTSASDLKGLNAEPFVIRYLNNVVPKAKLLVKPASWKRLFPDDPAEGDMCIYEAVPPDGYASLSHVPVKYYANKINRNDVDPDFRCVHQILLQKTDVDTNGKIWNDNESLWKLIDSPFFVWNGGDGPPPAKQDGKWRFWKLTNGSLFSNLTLTNVEPSKKSAQISWSPRETWSTVEINNTAESSTRFVNFTRTATTIATGSWSTKDSVSVENKLTVGVELEWDESGPFVGAKQTFTTEYELSVGVEHEHEIGGSTSTISTETFVEQVTVTIPAEVQSTITLLVWQGTCDVEYKGVLHLKSGDANSQQTIDIPMQGTFAYKMDSQTSLWSISEGTVVSQSQKPAPSSS